MAWTKDNSADIEELYTYLDKIKCGDRGWIFKTSSPYNKGSMLLASDETTIILRAGSNKKLLKKMKMAKFLLYKDYKKLIRKQAGGLGVVQPQYKGLL